MARDQQVAWINKTTDYAYVGTGLTKATAGPATVVTYEKNDSEHENGMYILFGDGHVELVPAEVARSTVAKSAKDRGL
jgi:prepilin-type processing-associated H-X9-DG protein